MADTTTFVRAPGCDMTCASVVIGRNDHGEVVIARLDRAGELISEACLTPEVAVAVALDLMRAAARVHAEVGSQVLQH